MIVGFLKRISEEGTDLMSVYFLLKATENDTRINTVCILVTWCSMKLKAMPETQGVYLV